MTAQVPENPNSAAPSRSHAPEPRTHAEVLAAEAQAKAARRQLELEELCSELNSAEQRVRTWEKVHGLALPENPDHPILDLIATKTGLTREAVLQVQRSDAERRAAVAVKHKKPGGSGDYAASR